MKQQHWLIIFIINIFLITSCAQIEKTKKNITKGKELFQFLTQNKENEENEIKVSKTDISRSVEGKKLSQILTKKNEENEISRSLKNNQKNIDNKVNRFLKQFSKLLQPIDPQNMFVHQKIEAEADYTRNRKKFGDSDPRTLKNLEDLAQYSYFDKNNGPQKSYLLHKKLYELKKEKFGERAPETLEELNTLAYVIHPSYSTHPSPEKLHFYEKAYNMKKEAGATQKELKDMKLVLMTLSASGTATSGLAGTLTRGDEASSLFARLGDSTTGVMDQMGSLNYLMVLLNTSKLSSSYVTLHRFDEALVFAKNAYESTKTRFGKSHMYTVMAGMNFAKVYTESGNINKGLSLAEKTYNIFQASKASNDLNPQLTSKDENNNKATLGMMQSMYGMSEVGILRQLAYIYHKSYQKQGKLNDLNKALNFAEAASKINKNILSPISAMLENLDGLNIKVKPKHRRIKSFQTLYILGIIHRDLGNSNKALSLLEEGYLLINKKRSKNRPKSAINNTNILYLYKDLAALYVKRGQIEKGIEHFEELVDIVENMRRDLSVENRQSFFKEWVKSYFTLSQLYIKKHRYKDAFYLVEKSKARTLLESLASKFSIKNSGLKSEDKRKWFSFNDHILSLNREITNALKNKDNIEKIMKIEAKKNRLITQLNQFEQQLRNKNSKYNQLRSVESINANDGSKFIPKNTVLINYLVNENKVLAFILKNNGKLIAHDLGEIPNLQEDLTNYRLGLAPLSESTRDKNQVMRKPNSNKRKRETNALSIKLGKYLLDPLKKEIKNNDKWIISPSDSLAAIPFETLNFKGEKEPIIIKHQISYVQSLSVLVRLDKRGKTYQKIKNRGTLFAMGAPIYESKSNTNLSQKWNNLKGAKKELIALEKLFKGTNQRIYKDADATETKLKILNKQGELSRYRYMVFSTHGDLNTNIPALSSIVLGQVNNPSGVDGYITAGEWPDYNLKSDLMVLSACKTGLGKVVGGEGIMGLPYALYVAGNKNTILTLWSISDDITVEFITSFFTKIKAGVGQVKALAATKREFIKRRVQPKYWAAFVLYGV